MTKKDLARKIITQEEIKNHVPIFQTKNWEKRKSQIANSVKLKEEKAQARKKEREAEPKLAEKLKKKRVKAVAKIQKREEKRRLKNLNKNK